MERRSRFWMLLGLPTVSAGLLTTRPCVSFSFLDSFDGKANSQTTLIRARATSFLTTLTKTRTFPT